MPILQCKWNRTLYNERYEYHFDEEHGFASYIQSTFQYVVGRNDTVTLEWILQPDFVVRCKATVNGQVCNECYPSICSDQFSGVQNVEGAGAAEICNVEMENANGPLAVFAFQDPVFLQGCLPRIFANEGLVA
jgi:hypothetical protein